MPNDTMTLDDSSLADSIPAPKIEVNGFFFEVPLYYTEGHVLSAAEAVALDQTRRENLRNIFAKTVKKAIEADDTSGLQAQFDELLASYQFTRTTIKGALDPVERKAHEIAIEMAKAALNQNNIKKSDLQEGVFEKFVEDILGQKPEIFEEARNQIERAKSLASGLTLGSVA